MNFAPAKVAEKPLKTLQVEIERLLPGGVGLAHTEGLTVFVSLAAPGDVVRVRFDRTRGKVAFASIQEIIMPSPLRIEPPCPYFGRCGGCDFQQLKYETQLKAKVEIIRDCLHRIAHVEAPAEVNIHPSPNQWQYRARANWQVDPQTSALGYFERGSHEVCDVAECAVLVPELQRTLETLREGIREGTLQIPQGDIEAVAGDEAVSVIPNFRRIEEKQVSRKIGTDTYYFSAGAFFQINHSLLQSLIAEAIHEAHGKRALDLYCGAGLFTLPLARRFERVTSVDSNRTAAAFARRNLKNAQLTNAKIVTSRVADWLRAKSNSFAGIDIVLLDPPRTGVEAGVIAGILKLHPETISYVSCDPATLARDLKELLAGGYSLDSVMAFDMFPQTHHVETVARLSIERETSKS